MGGALGSGRLGTVLCVDDEPHNRELFRVLFEEERDFAIETADSAATALSILSRSSDIAVLLTDERMPGMRGVELLAQAAQRWPDVVRVIVSAYGDAPRILSAINLGHAHEYILKPWSHDELGDCLRRALAIATRRRALGEAAARAAHVEADVALAYGDIVGLRPVLALASRLAPLAAPILVQGEPGTGKELVARHLHAESKRPGAFLRVACARIAAERIAAELFGEERGGEVVTLGRLESASGGSVFLDDVAALPLPVQAALSHALDEGAFERVGGQRPVALRTRILASSHRDLAALARRGELSSELVYHFNVVVDVPPLRARVDDIAALALHFAEKHTRPGEAPKGIDAEALAALAAYAWPGNVRELEGIVARAVALSTGPELGVEDFTFRLDLPPASPASAVSSPAPSADLANGVLSVRDEARANEMLEVRRLLLAHGGNVSRAARAIGVPRTTLLSRAKKLGLLS